MPFYDFECPECDRTETIFRVLAEYKKDLPQCCNREMDRVYSVSALWNRETSFSNPVRSPIDGKHYSSRNKWDSHLKQHGCFEVGNDSSVTNPKPRETQGDFDVSKELKQAVNQVLQ